VERCTIINTSDPAAGYDPISVVFRPAIKHIQLHPGTTELGAQLVVEVRVNGLSRSRSSEPSHQYANGDEHAQGVPCHVLPPFALCPSQVCWQSAKSHLALKSLVDDEIGVTVL
jgi:hypothetical protein